MKPGKIIQWVYDSLKYIAPEDRTTFEKQLWVKVCEHLGKDASK